MSAARNQLLRGPLAIVEPRFQIFNILQLPLIEVCPPRTCTAGVKLFAYRRIVLLAGFGCGGAYSWGQRDFLAAAGVTGAAISAGGTSAASFGGDWDQRWRGGGIESGWDVRNGASDLG